MLIKNTSLALAAFLPAPTPALEAGTLTLSAPATGEGWGGRKTIRPPASVPGVKEADPGVLKTEQRRVVECPTECDDGFAGYCDGTPIDPMTGCWYPTSYQECCIGRGACAGFTGCVKKDGSCGGPYACNFASATSIEGSCKDEYSCGSMYVLGKVENSCNAVAGACANLGVDGKVETLISSCNAMLACYGLGAYGGDIGAVTKSCNRDSTCMLMGGAIKSITKTCNNAAHTPCRVLANDGTVGHLTKFTHTDVGEKFNRDSIGSIEECYAQCASDSECKGIKWKEHTSMPCRFFGGEISENKCNGRNVCITV